MEVSGQLHAPVALPLGKEPLVPIGQEAGWASQSVYTLWEVKRNLLLLSGIESRPFSPVVRRYIQYIQKVNKIMEALRN
jgi:hypothetical protein